MPASLVDALHAISRSITEVQAMLEAGAVPQPAQFARVTDLVGEVARSRDALVDAVEEMRAAVADALAAYPWLGAAP
jgi:hypothetical protein